MERTTMNRKKIILFFLIFLLNCEQIKKLFGESMEKKSQGFGNVVNLFMIKKRRIMFDDLREAIDYKNPNKSHFFDYYMELDWKNKKERMKLIVEDKIYDLKLKEGEGETFIIEYPTGKQRTVYFRDK